MGKRWLCLVLLSHSLCFILGGKERAFSPSSEAKVQTWPTWHFHTNPSGQEVGYTSDFRSVSVYPGLGRSDRPLTLCCIISACPQPPPSCTVYRPAGLKVRSGDHHHQCQLGTCKEENTGPSPRPTKSENLGLGLNWQFHRPSGVSGTGESLEPLAEKNSLWERGLIWGRIYFHSNNGSLAKGQVRWTSRIYQMPEKEREEK